jgi:hypothetical protein
MKRISYIMIVCFVIAQIFTSCKNDPSKGPVD